MARSPLLLAPSPSLFPSEEMAGCWHRRRRRRSRVYVFTWRTRSGGERRGRERGEGGKERSAGKQAEEDHHLVPVRLCVCACECLPPPSYCSSFPPSRTRRGRGGRGRMPLNNQQKTIVAPEGMLGWWKKWTVAEPLMRVYCYFGIGMGLCFTFPLSSSIIDDERVCRGLWTWMRGRGRGGILLPGSDRRRSRSSRSWPFEYHITA